MNSDQFYDTSAQVWVEKSVALLRTLRQVEETGELPADAVVSAAFADGTFEEIVQDHLGLALQGSYERYDAYTRALVDKLLVLKDIESATRVGDWLQQEAAHGSWLQSVPLGDSTCGALEGESTLFGFGVFLDRGEARDAPFVRRPQQLEHLKALLLADFQIGNAFRIVLLPVLLGSPQTAQLGSWHMAQLRKRMEGWVESHPTGHPDVETTQAWLAELGAVTAQPQYTDLAGRQASAAGVDGLSLMDSYVLCGLVLHSPADPVEASEVSTQSSPVQSMLFPRSQAYQVQAYLEAEHKHLKDMLACGMVASEQAYFEQALTRCEADQQTLDAHFGPCLLEPKDPRAAAPDSASGQLQEYLAEVLSPTPQCLMVVASANGYYESLRPAREALRYLRLRAMLNHAGARVGLEGSTGLRAEVLLDDERHQAVIHLHHPDTGMYAGMGLWPLNTWESAEQFYGGLNEALRQAGVERVAPAAPTGGLH